MSETFNPYRKWLGIPLAEQPPNHYRLLGIALFEDDPDVIAYAADRQMSHVRKFQSGQYGGDAQKLLSELAQARRCLLSSSERVAYDNHLRSSAVRAPVAAPQPSKASPPPSPPPPQPSPPQPAPPPTAAAQSSAQPSQPTVATMEVPKAVPVAVASNPQSNMAVRTRSVTSSSRRARRKNSALPMVAVMFALVGFGLVGMIVAVAMNSEFESGESDDVSGQAAAPATTRVQQPVDDSPEPPKPPRTNRPKPNPPNDNTPSPRTNPPAESGSDAGPPDKGTQTDTGSASPAPPPVDVNDPQRAERFEAAATAAASALAGRDMATAAEQLTTADGLKFTDEEQAMVLVIQELHDYLDQFWPAVDRGLAKLQPGDDVVFGDSIANFVSAKDDDVRLLIRGSRSTHKLRELNAAYLVAIAQRGLDAGDADGKLILAAFLAIDQRAASQEQFRQAKSMYDEAVAGGAKSDVLAERFADVDAPQPDDPAPPQDDDGQDAGEDPALPSPPKEGEAEEEEAPPDDLPKLPAGFPDPDKGLPKPNGPPPNNIPDEAPR